MTELSQQDQELIRRYLAGSLTDEEEFVLETRIVEDSGFRGELELTAALQEGLRDLDARGEISGLLAGSRDRWQLQVPAIAASIGALVVGLLLIVYLSTRPSPPPPPVVTASLYFERTRAADASDAVRWIRRSTPTILQLHFDVGASPAPRYRVMVRRRDNGSAVPMSDTVEQTTNNGEAVISVMDSRLEPGEFEVRLVPVSATGTEATLTYHLVVTDP